MEISLSVTELSIHVSETAITDAFDLLAIIRSSAILGKKDRAFK